MFYVDILPFHCQITALSFLLTLAEPKDDALIQIYSIISALTLEGYCHFLFLKMVESLKAHRVSGVPLKVLSYSSHLNTTRLS